MTTTEQTHTLTADDVAALRAADNVTFHVHLRNGYIRAHLHSWSGERVLTARDHRLFPQVDNITGDRERTIACDWKAFGFNGLGMRELADVGAFASVINTAFSYGAWPSTARTLRTGDAVRLVWLADGGNTTHVEAAGLHVDELKLEITSPRRAEPLIVHVDTRINPGNSARMIHGWIAD